MVEPIKNRSIEPVAFPPSESIATRKTTPSQNFAQVLQQVGQELPLKFSAHAQARVQTRNLEVTSSQLQRLHNGAAQAAAKGCRDSLVVVDNLAFVVSIANRTVVTALGGEALKNNVFTNIDSAVIA